MYLLFITLGLCGYYYFCQYLFAYLFNSKEDVRQDAQVSITSLLVIILVSVISYGVSLSFSDPQISNRLLHALGGGFAATVASFLALKDSCIGLKTGQFAIFTLLLVTALGVGNEIVEFVLQNYFDMEITRSVNDTWLDLVSNTVGGVLALGMVVPLYPRLGETKLQ